MESKRHVCIVCKRKKAVYKMVQHGQHWSCLECLTQGNQAPDLDGAGKLRALNLYAGIGGNRYLWPKSVSVTAVEKDPKIAAAYKELFPNDLVIVGDAHKYLLKNYYRFDIIGSSPPCQSHTRLNYVLPVEKKRYIDLSLWQQIVFLKHFFKGRWWVENVIPYYDPFIEPTAQIGRHCFWANFAITDCFVPALPGGIDWNGEGDGTAIKEWLGFSISKNIRLNGNNCLQVYRNCVHPKIGLSVFNDAINSMIYGKAFRRKRRTLYG